MGEQKRKNSYFKDAEEDLKIICDQLPDSFEEVTETKKVLGLDFKKMNPKTTQAIVDNKYYRISYTKLKKVSHFHRLKDFILENLSEENDVNEIIKKYVAKVDKQNKDLNKKYAKL
jgi:hypothetical protein